jgi:hypothetical protein
MIRFQADADLNQTILLATVRRSPRLDFQSATAAGLAGLTDLEVLTLASGQGRILVTHDKRTMPLHFADFIKGAHSPGVLVVPQSLSVSMVADDLLLVASATQAVEWVNRIAYLPI